MGYRLQADWWAQEGLVSETWQDPPQRHHSQPALLSPAHLPLGAAQRVMVSQPASDFGNALEGLAAPWMCRKRICNGEPAGKQTIAWLVHFLIYIWTREKNASSNALGWWPQSTSPATQARATQGRQPLIRDPSDTQELGLSPCLSSQAPVPVSLTNGMFLLHTRHRFRGKKRH